MSVIGVTQLNMPMNDIHTIQSGAFSCLQKLKILYFHDNDIKVLPESAFLPVRPLRLLDTFASKIAGNCNFWTFRLVIQLIEEIFKIRRKAFLHNGV